MAVNRSLMRTSLSLLSYILLASVIGFFLVERAEPTLTKGALAPIDEQFSTLNGQTKTIARNLRRPLVINFFATWCPPCVKEMPVFSKMEKKYRGKINFLGLAMASEQAAITAFKKQFFLDYELGMVSDAVGARWYARTMPTTYIVDKKGVIFWAHAGIVTESELDAALSAALR